MDPQSFDDMRTGCYDIHDRVKDMNANGILGSMCFPSFPQFCGQLFARAALKDEPLATALVQAYNDWHIESWCGAYPGRFIPLAIPMIAGPSALATVLLASRQSGQTLVWISAIILASVINALFLLASGWFARLFGKAGMLALERLMGLILTTMAVQMLISGIRIAFHLS